MVHLISVVVGLIGFVGIDSVTVAEVTPTNSNSIRSSAPIVNYSVPGPVQNLVAQPGIGTVTLSWDPPAGSSPYMIEGYKIEEYWNTQVSNGRPSGQWLDVVENTRSRSTTYFREGYLTFQYGGLRLKFRVAAIVAGEQGEWNTIEEINTLRIVRPQPPIEVVAVPGPGQVELRWKPPMENGGSRITRYRIDFQIVSDKEPRWRIGTIGDTTGTRITHRNLQPGWAVRYRVYAWNRSGRSREHSAVVEAIPLPVPVPGAPTSLMAIAGVTHVDLSWDAPIETGGANRYWYRIEHAANNQNNWQVTADRVTGTEYQHVDLTPSHAYEYRVAAANLSGVGAYSPTVATSTGVRRAPFAPVGLTSLAYHDRLHLFWEAPTNNAGEPITGYRVEYQAVTADPETDVWIILHANSASTATAYEHTDLMAGESSRYRVAALSGTAATIGDYSEVLVAAALSNEPVAPTLREVGWRNCMSSNCGAPDIWFDMPPEPAGGAITSFSLEYSWVDDSAPRHWRSVATFDNNNWTAGQQDVERSNLSIPALPSTTNTVYLRLIAINDAGSSPPSNTVSNTGAGIRIHYPRNPAKPTHFFGLARDTSIDFRWSPPDANRAAITGYVIQRQVVVETEDGNAPEEVWVEVYSGPGHVLAQTVADLAPEFDLNFRLAAVNAVGLGTWSNTLRMTASEPSRPEAPPRVTATDGIKEVQVQWEAPLWDGGDPITAYRVESSTVGADGPWTTQAELDGTASAYMHAGLAPGILHHYRIIAINSLGDGTPSNVVTGMAVRSAPDPPNPLVVFSGRDGFELNWTIPADGGAPIQSYSIEHRSEETSNHDWVELVVLDQSPLSNLYTVTGFSAGVATEFRVSASNSEGTGVPSDVAIGTANLALSGPPQNLAAHAYLDRTEVSWERPYYLGGAGVLVTGFRVDRSWDDGVSWTTLTVTSSADRVFTDMETALGDSTFYRVFAVNDAGPSLPSSVATTVLAPALPPTPLGVTVTTDRLQNTISWHPVPSTLRTDVTGYRIVHAASATSNAWSPLAVVKSSSVGQFIHSDLEFDQTVYYRVGMNSAVGTGPFSDPVAGTTIAATTVWDVDAANGYTEDDALTVYYALTFGQVLGDGQVDTGFARVRCQILFALAECSDDNALRQSLRNVRQLLNTWGSGGLDVNDDEVFDWQDALIMYYASNSAMLKLLGSGEEDSGKATYRHTFLSPLAGMADASDVELRELIKRVHDLVGHTPPLSGE